MANERLSIRVDQSDVELVETCRARTVQTASEFLRGLIRQFAAEYARKNEPQQLRKG